MSHVARTGSQAATRGLSRALAIAAAVLVLAGIAVVLIVTIGGDDTTKVSSPAPVGSVARPDEGAATGGPASESALPVPFGGRIVTRPHQLANLGK